MKTTTSKVASKLKVKKGPNPVKTALRSLHDYLHVCYVACISLVGS